MCIEKTQTSQMFCHFLDYIYQFTDIIYIIKNDQTG